MTNKPTNKTRFPKLKEAEEEVLKEMRKRLNPKGESQYEELGEFLIEWLTMTQSLQGRVLNSLRNTHRKLGHSEPIIKWLEETHKSQREVFDSLITMHKNLGNEDLEDRYTNMMVQSNVLELFYGNLVTHCQELRQLLISTRTHPQP